jgi:hypothetical protein
MPDGYSEEYIPYSGASTQNFANMHGMNILCWLNEIFFKKNKHYAGQEMILLYHLADESCPIKVLKVLTGVTLIEMSTSC